MQIHLGKRDLNVVFDKLAVDDLSDFAFYFFDTEDVFTKEEYLKIQG